MHYRERESNGHWANTMADPDIRLARGDIIWRIQTLGWRENLIGYSVSHIYLVVGWGQSLQPNWVGPWTDLPGSATGPTSYLSTQRMPPIVYSITVNCAGSLPFVNYLTKQKN